MPGIHGYHPHVYFNAQTLDRARALCEAETEKFACAYAQCSPEAGRAASGLELSVGFWA